MTIPTIADLRKTTGFSTEKRANVLGYYTIGDGGGGDFWWDEASTEEDNDGTIFKVQNNLVGRWKRIYKDSICRPEWFGAIADGITDCLAAFNKMLSGSFQKILINGHYAFSDTLVIDGKEGFSIEGVAKQHINSANDKINNSCVLDFDGVPPGRNGLEIKNFKSVQLKDIYVSYIAIGNVAGKGVHLYAGFGFSVIGLIVDITGSTNNERTGLSFGAGTPSTSCFCGYIDGGRVLSTGGICYETNAANTTINFRNTYATGGRYKIYGTVYSSFTSCACDNPGIYGYHITGDMNHNSTNLTFTSCGCEGAFKSAIWIDNYSQNITLLDPYTADSNKEYYLSGGLSGQTNGALLTINAVSAFVRNINVVNPTALLCYGLFGISVLGGNGWHNIRIDGTNQKLFSNQNREEILGIYSDSPFKLKVNGDLSNVDFMSSMGFENMGDTSTITINRAIYNREYNSFVIKFLTITLREIPIISIITLPFNFDDFTIDFFHKPKFLGKGIIYNSRIYASSVMTFPAGAEITLYGKRIN